MEISDINIPSPNKLIMNRWSPVVFSDKMVEEEQLLTLFEAARWAPSSMNEQPWRFIYATKDNHRNKRAITDSRIQSVRVLNETLSKLSSPPACFIQCGAIGYYGNKEEKCDENTKAGNGFLADLAKKWEEEFYKTSLPATRKVIIRIGLPLSLHGGLLPPLISLARLYLGGSAGSGKQYLSWIHGQDLNRVFEWALENEKAYGIYNGNAPYPVRNANFMKTLRTQLNKPWSPPAPSILVKLGARYIFRTEPSLALSGCFSVPSKLLSEGFTFNFPYLEGSLRDILTT